MSACIEEIVKWIVENVSDLDVPDDEGNGDALRYNLVHLARDGKDYRHYYYAEDQEDEIATNFGISTKLDSE